MSFDSQIQDIDHELTKFDSPTIPFTCDVVNPEPRALSHNGKRPFVDFQKASQVFPGKHNMLFRLI